MKLSKHELEKIFCNECLREMKHIELSSVEKRGSDDYISWENKYQVMECHECGNIVFRRRHWFSEDQWGDEPCYTYSYYPPIVSRPKPAWFDELSDELTDVLEEVYVALDTNSRFLAAFGARTALDIMMVDKIGDVGSFQQKLDALESKGYISATEKELLDAVTEAGNAAAHRGYAPDSKLLSSVMDILESVLDKIYFKPERDKELLEKARELKGRVPPRKK
jgi:uncharacterized protein YutE (UPF0331/DUF86 family)